MGSKTGPEFHDPTMHTWGAHREQWQEVTNRVKAYPAREDTHPLNNVPVRVRLVWERGDEEYVETVAQAWAGPLGYVVVPDHRWRYVGLWLHHTDIRRLSAQQ